jgi:hypothetical protein
MVVSRYAVWGPRTGYVESAVLAGLLSSAGFQNP